MKYRYQLTCQCGRQRRLSFADIPPSWLGHDGLSLRREALERMACLHCNHRGSPAQVELFEIENA